MRKSGLIFAASAGLVTACSSGDVGQQADDRSETPDVSPTAAPGVAFRYSYAFQLPDESISAVQEAHASKCEALGTARCRITGLRYSVEGEKAISAMLEVKLAPTIARQFGKAATAEVEKADGQLLSTQFDGEDVTPVTAQAGRQQSDTAARIAGLERQLATATTGEERAQLQRQLNELQTQLEAAQATAASAAERLASTPMTFNYYGRGGIAGFAGNPVRDAVRSFVSSFVTMVTVLLQLLAVLLPWLLLLALLVLLWRSRPGRAVRDFFSTRRTTEEEA